ncbi:MAG: outer membrane beta-barrel protein [Cyclobacteriaceae bacterium]
MFFKGVVTIVLSWTILSGLYAQDADKITISGRAVDASSGEALIGAHVKILHPVDSSQLGISVADIDGAFTILIDYRQKAILQIGFMGYQHESKLIDLPAKGQNLKLGNVGLTEDSRFLSELVIESTAIIGENYGDTTAFNAAAFKTRPDAATEDLIRKMPGIALENGTITAQGEAVTEVLVDGKLFFGDDAAAALKNLPAEVVKKIEVFDQLSEQSQFTGIDDGNTKRTINIVTKPETRKGQFGKVYAGYGTDNRYLVGGNVNLFNNDRRISIIGLSNNVNQQNFSSDDLLGVQGDDNQPRRGDDNFQVNQQPGITKTNGIGLNFSDTWGKKLEMSGSYFYNRGVNENWRLRSREFFLPDGSQFMNEMGETNSINTNHRINIRFEYKFNDRTSLIYRPRINLQSNETQRNAEIVNTLDSDELLSDSKSIRNYEGDGSSISNFFLLRHRFDKKGRTFSVRLSTSNGNNERLSGLRALDRSYGESFSSDSVQQIRLNSDNNFSYNTRLSFTEGFGNYSMLEANYSFGNKRSNSLQETFNYDFENLEYAILDEMLSNSFNNTFFSQRTGLKYNFNNDKWNINAGIDYQNSQLDNQQVFPNENNVFRRFENALPSARFQYKFSKQANLRLTYNTDTREPSIYQLQNVVSVFNSMSFYEGNSNLSQSFSHNASLRYAWVNPETKKSLTLYGSAYVVDDYISNATVIAQQDTLIGERQLVQGGQFRYPVNLNGMYNLRTYMSYGTYLKFIKTNANFSTRVNFRRMPGMINYQNNLTHNVTMGQGLTLSSNISENLDFNFTTRFNYNIVTNELRPNLNNNFSVQSSRVDLFWRFWKDLFIDNNLAHHYYTGLSDAVNPNFMLWNVSVGKKVMQDNGEIKLTVFDFLNQNNSLDRNVTDVYVEDVQQLVLQQYYMLTFTYNIRNFNLMPTGKI